MIIESISINDLRQTQNTYSKNLIWKLIEILDKH